jgi:hypothetical protein
MLVVCLLPLPAILSVTPALAEPCFSEKYERDYHIYNPLNQYRPDNPLNLITKNPFNLNEYNPHTPFQPLNR